MSRRERLSITELMLAGFITDSNHAIIFSKGKEVPNNKRGYSPGCIFIKNGDDIIYVNKGTINSSFFQQLDSQHMVGGHFTI